MADRDRAEIVCRSVFANDWEQLAHTARVVARLVDLDASDEELAVAWLHDVIEDTPIHPADLEDMGFSRTVIDAVVLLTRATGSDYNVYKNTLCSAGGEVGRIARKVKLADARDNLGRCEASRGVPKWARLAETRYRPLIELLERQVSLDGRYGRAVR